MFKFYEDIENASRQKLIDIIRGLKIQNEELINEKEYGLVWKDQLEQVEEKLKDNYPVLKEIAEKEINTNRSKPINLMIEGDNLHSLNSLLYTHENMIDIVYIDPPYNSGNKDFIYNDDYVDREDCYRHSKWLSFMYKRLNIAKKLIKDTGVCFISIDDNEMAQLKLLCDKIFSEKNFVDIFIWEKNTNPTFLAKTTRKNVEYILCYKKSEQFSGLVENIKNQFQDAPIVNKDNPIDVLNFKKGTVRFRIPDKLYTKDSATGDTVLLDDVIVKEGMNENDFSLKGKFRWKQNTLDNELQRGGQVIIKSKKFSPRFIYGNNKLKIVSPMKTIDYRQNVGTNLEASSQLRRMNVDGFNYPKPVSLLKYLIALVQNKNAIVLDFFAGSGTTGNAVLELNNEDKGNRQFILCTNNENGICENVTYPRISKVIKGYIASNGVKIKGIGGNLKYFKTEFISKKQNIDDLRYQMANKCEELLRIKENAFEALNITESYKIYKNANKAVAIYTDYIHYDILKKIKEDLIQSNLPKKILYLYMKESELQDYEIQKLINFDIDVKPIPDKIIKIYDKILRGF